MSKNITGFVILYLSVLLLALAIPAKLYYPDATNSWGFLTVIIAIVCLLPWWRLEKTTTIHPNKSYLWLSAGVGAFLLTVWLWIY